MATRWRFDTCACAVEFEDGAAANGDGSGVTYVNTCPRHAAIAQPAARYLAARRENRQKNVVSSRVESMFPGRTYAWSIRASDGACLVVLTGTGAERTQLRNALANDRADGQPVVAVVS